MELDETPTDSKPVGASIITVQLKRLGDPGSAHFSRRMGAVVFGAAIFFFAGQVCESGSASAAGKNAAPNLTTSKFKKMFLASIFRVKDSKNYNFRRKRKIKKWSGSININFSQPVGNVYIRHVNLISRRFSMITNLSINVSNTLNADGDISILFLRNIDVLFREHPKLIRKMGISRMSLSKIISPMTKLRSGDCVFFWRSERGVVVRGLIVMNDTLGGLFPYKEKRCITSGMYGILGVTGLVDNRYSFRNKKSKFITPTKYDQLILKILYDNNIKPHMRESQVELVLQKLLYEKNMLIS